MKVIYYTLTSVAALVVLSWCGFGAYVHRDVIANIMCNHSKCCCDCCKCCKCCDCCKCGCNDECNNGGCANGKCCIKKK